MLFKQELVLKNSNKSEDIDYDIALIKDFLEDAIENFAVFLVYALLFELERTRKRERRFKWLSRKASKDVRKCSAGRWKTLIAEVSSAIEDLKDKRMQFIAEEREFQMRMNKVKRGNMELSSMEEWLTNKERELTVVGKY